jgi:Sap, sulfolipid-1-addressing protein
MPGCCGRLTGLLPTLVVDGLGIAAAPWCIIGVIVILGTTRPLANAASFLGGAVVSMVVVYGLCWVAFGDLDLTVHTAPASSAATIQLVSGVALFGWGGWRWYRRPATTSDSPEPTEPRWMSSIDRVRPLVAFPIGLCMPNPVLAVAGSLAILKADLATAEAVLALFFFILVSLCTLIAPVVVYVRSPDAVAVRLAAWRKRLATNSGMILTVLLVFYGVLLTLEGVNGLRT